MRLPRKPSAEARRSRALRRLRVWVALRLQARRRRRAATVPEVPAAPEITAGYADLGGTEPGWFDAVIEFSFVHGSFPVAQLELWLSIDDGAYALVTTLASTETFYLHECVEQGEDTLRYKLRYRNGAVLGPFSNVMQINPQL